MFTSVQFKVVKTRPYPNDNGLILTMVSEDENRFSFDIEVDNEKLHDAEYIRSLCLKPYNKQIALKSFKESIPKVGDMY